MGHTGTDRFISLSEWTYRFTCWHWIRPSPQAYSGFYRTDRISRRNCDIQVLTEKGILEKEVLESAQNIFLKHCFHVSSGSSGQSQNKSSLFPDSSARYSVRITENRASVQSVVDYTNRLRQSGLNAPGPLRDKWTVALTV